MDTANQIKCEEKEEMLFNAYSIIFYFTGSIIALEPEEEGLPEFCSAGLLRNLPVSSNNPGFRTALAFFNAPCHSQARCHQNVSEHYQMLFGSKDNSTSWPTESSWPSFNDEILHKTHGSLNEFYSRHSFSPENDRFLPADHLGVELLFLNRLMTGFIKTQDQVVKTALKNDIIGFTSSHLLNWLPGWVKSVSENSDTKCFKGIAHLILASVEDVKSLVINCR